jgi:hypothetical protein
VKIVSNRAQLDQDSERVMSRTSSTGREEPRLSGTGGLYQAMCSGEAAVVSSGLRGYRCWNWHGPQRLGSVGEFGEWSGITENATCRLPARRQLKYGGHRAPHESCTCGIYGWYRPNETRLRTGDVFGVIEASGRIIVGDFGFRAESARIVAVVSEERGWFESQGVPVFKDRDALLAAFQPPDIEEVLGQDAPPGDHIVGAGWVAIQIDPGRAVELSARMAKAALASETSRDAIASRTHALELRKRRHSGPPAPRLDGRKR